MVYFPLKPASTDNLSVSQGDIQGNFQTANTIMNINHYPFDDVTTNKGMHRFVELPRVGAPPGSLTPANGVVYTGTANGETQLFYSPDNSNIAYQLTATNSTENATFKTNTNYAPVIAGRLGGWTFLPGGLLLQYGTLNVAIIGTPTTLLFPRAFLALTVPYSITLGFINNGGDSPAENAVYVKQGTVTNIGCDLTNSSAGDLTSVYWMAIGAASP